MSAEFPSLQPFSRSITFTRLPASLAFSYSLDAEANAAATAAVVAALSLPSSSASFLLHQLRQQPFACCRRLCCAASVSATEETGAERETVWRRLISSALLTADATPLLLCQWLPDGHSFILSLVIISLSCLTDELVILLLPLSCFVSFHSSFLPLQSILFHALLLA